MPATLKNISNQPVVVILDHPAFLNPQAGWQRTTAQFANTQDDGGRSVVEVRRSIPGSITLMPGESKKGLHSAIRNCSQVPNLLRRNALTITEENDR